MPPTRKVRALGAALYWRLAVRSQQVERVRWIGVLMSIAADERDSEWIGNSGHGFRLPSRSGGV